MSWPGKPVPSSWRFTTRSTSCAVRILPISIRLPANLVDSKMRAVSAHGATVDSLRVAVLAALNIADELTSLRARYDSLYNTMTQSQSVRTRAGSLASPTCWMKCSPSAKPGKEK